MARDLDSLLQSAITSGLIQPAFFCVLTFRSATRYVWSGVGEIVVDAQTYVGVGSLGKIGSVVEGIEVKADGTTLTLSGIDPVLLNESLEDIQPGLPATLAFGNMSNGVLIGRPYQLFAGTMDVPSVTVGTDTISITLALETTMLDLSRPSMRRYTSADQRLYFPTDCGFSWVEPLNDQALGWGT
jgi:hypothetical protein